MEIIFLAQESEEKLLNQTGIPDRLSPEIPPGGADLCSLPSACNPGLFHYFVFIYLFNLSCDSSQI